MQGQKPKEASVFPIGDDCYANACVDAAVVTAIAGMPREPFWLSTHTHSIRWMRHAFAFIGKPHPILEEIFKIAQ